MLINKVRQRPLSKFIKPNPQQVGALWFLCIAVFFCLLIEETKNRQLKIYNF